MSGKPSRRGPLWLCTACVSWLAGSRATRYGPGTHALSTCTFISTWCSSCPPTPTPALRVSSSATKHTVWERPRQAEGVPSCVTQLRTRTMVVAASEGLSPRRPYGRDPSEPRIEAMDRLHAVLLNGSGTSRPRTLNVTLCFARLDRGLPVAITLSHYETMEGRMPLINGLAQGLSSRSA